MKLNLNPIVVTGVGVSAPIPCDTRSNPTNLGISCVVSATATYTVQYTMDDVFAPGYNPSTGNWTTFTAYATPPTTSTQLNVTQFATAIRLNVSASTGTVSIQAWQTDSTQGG